MSSLRWRNLEPRTCGHCGKSFEVESLSGAPPSYCGKLCSGRAKRHRRITREVAAEITERHEERAEVEPLSVGEEFALLRKQRRARMEGRA